jgi:hypothetical protein
VSSSFAATSSYNLNSISSSYSLTASFAANAGSSLSTGSTYPITSSWATTSSNIIGGTSNYIPLWSTNTSLGNSVLYQNSSNIGIGTTSPASILHLQSSAATTLLRIDNSTNTNDAAILLTDSTNPTGEGLRITYDSSIGDTYFNNIFTGSTRAFNFQKGDFGSGTSLLTILNDGNVGIGTTSPGYKLDVVGAVRSTIDNSFSFASNRSAITVWSGLGFLTNNVNKWFLGLRETSDDNLRWYNFTNSSERMVLTETGNLGIGTTSPAYKLDVNGSASFADNVIITKNQNALTRLIVSNTTSNSSSYVETAFVNDASSGTGAVGRYGATTTTYKIVTANNQYLYNGPTAGDIAILNDFASGSIKMSAGGNSNVQFIISSPGNVGIGTTSPVAKLHVNGNISGSSFTGSVFGTSSWATNASTASYVVNSVSSSYALTASYALNAGSGGGSSSTSSLIGQTFVPTASVSQLSLTQSVSNNDQILVILDGLVQSRTGSYTVSGSTLTLTENAESGSIIDVRYLAGSSSGGSSVSSSYALTSSFSTTIAPRTAIYRYGTTSVVNPGGYANTVVKYDTAVTDSTGWYNNTTGRFTPTVAGWYQVSAGARVYGGSAAAEGYFTLLKNADQIAIVGGIGNVFGFISILVYFNGSTDYISFCSNMSAAITNAQNSGSTPFTMVYMTS